MSGSTEELLMSESVSRPIYSQADPLDHAHFPNLLLQLVLPKNIHSLLFIMQYKRLALLGAVGSVAATGRPSDVSICDYYTNGESQSILSLLPIASLLAQTH